MSAINGKEIPVYGNGQQVRDWLFVDDHVKALLLVAKQAQIGQTYNIGGGNEIKNINLVNKICEILEDMKISTPKGLKKFSSLINFVEDRPGHDYRYAIDTSKIKRDLEWTPLETFDSGLKKTILWYFDNQEWWKKILQDKYQLKRLGKI